MNESKKQTVEMTAEEMAEYKAFQEAKAKKEAEAKADRDEYKQLVDER